MEWSIDLPEDMKNLLEMIRLEQSDVLDSLDDLGFEEYLDESSDDMDDDVLEGDE
jgi:hypothetical protein